MDTPEWAIEPEKQQGGDAWHAWRAKGLGGSDAPILMGASPWKTPYRLWQNKTGKVKNVFMGNPATEWGNKCEPVARRKFEEKVGRKFPAETFANGIFLASMDGWEKSQKEGLEIKFVGLGDFTGAQLKEVPTKYKWQLVHQFIATGANIIWFAAYYCPIGSDVDAGELVYFPVLKNHEDCQEYMKKANEFWQFVLLDKAPPLMDKDTAVIEGTQLAILADKYKAFDEDAKLANAQLAHIKAEIIEWVKVHGHKIIECNGVRITRVDKAKNPFYKVEIKANK